MKLQKALAHYWPTLKLDTAWQIPVKWERDATSPNLASFERGAALWAWLFTFCGLAQKHLTVFGPELNLLLCSWHPFAPHAQVQNNILAIHHPLTMIKKSSQILVLFSIWSPSISSQHVIDWWVQRCTMGVSPAERPRHQSFLCSDQPASRWLVGCRSPWPDWAKYSLTTVVAHTLVWASFVSRINALALLRMLNFIQAG